jgi:hypothetical protein
LTLIETAADSRIKQEKPALSWMPPPEVPGQCNQNPASVLVPSLEKDYAAGSIVNDLPRATLGGLARRGGKERQLGSTAVFLLQPVRRGDGANRAGRRTADGGTGADFAIPTIHTDHYA